MTTDPEVVRQEIVELYKRRKEESIADRDFQKQSVERSVALCRSVVETRLDPQESIVLEHHIIEAHTALNRSILKEPEQRAVSLFLTEKRLVRLQSRMFADRPPSCDEADKTAIDEISLRDVKAWVMRREIREGELIAGLVIALFSLVFSSLLLFTAKIMLWLGLLGALHAVVFANRRLELQTRTPSDKEPFVLLKLRTKSAKKMRAAVEQHIKDNTTAPSG
jgi:hypothetical protein